VPTFDLPPSNAASTDGSVSTTTGTALTVIRIVVRSGGSSVSTPVAATVAAHNWREATGSAAVFEGAPTRQAGADPPPSPVH
jgi:hypothetical protein